jgi:hypothetical protein
VGFVGSPVIDPRAPVAQGVAAPQVRVQAVEDVDTVLQLAQRHITQGGLERPADVALIRLAGAQLVVDDLDPPVEEVSDRGGLVRDPFGLDLGDEPIPRALGRRPVRVGLVQVDLRPVMGSLPA